MAKTKIYCTYCGKENPGTVDHIPPASLFPSPRPSNLITVPSCLKCNATASTDDEYFKIWLVMRWDIGDHPEASKLLDSIHRGLVRPQKRKMLVDLKKSMKTVNLHTVSGLYLGKTASYQVDLARLGKVTNRIVKGLFYKENGQRLSSEYDVVSYAESGLRNINVPTFAKLSNIVQALNSKPLTKIGNNIFEYRFQCTPEDINVSVWLLRFYNAESFLCFTGPNAKTV